MLAPSVCLIGCTLPWSWNWESRLYSNTDISTGWGVSAAAPSVCPQTLGALELISKSTDTKVRSCELAFTEQRA